MTKHRFFISPENILSERVSFPKDVQAQICRVLRLNAGDEVEVLDNTGKAFLVKLTKETDHSYTGEILSSRIVNSDSGVCLTLYFGLTQRAKMEWVLQKGTEVGIATFQPYISRRTLAQQAESAKKHHTRWEAILREASEQSGRGRIPKLFPPQEFNDVLKVSTASCGQVIAAWEDEKTQDLRTALGNSKPTSIGLFCGPEGGFDPGEIDLMRAAGVHFFSLGKRILRMETAAIIASALVLYELDEMSI